MTEAPPPARKPRGTYFEKLEAKLREGMGHALGDAKPGRPGRPSDQALSLAATAVGPLLGMSTSEAKRFLDRARFLIDAGEIGPDLLRRMQPATYRNPRP